MAKASDFIRTLSALPGVAGYLLCHSNGRILSHNLSDPDAYMPWSQHMIQHCTLVSSSLNNETFRGVSLQHEGSIMHMFPIRQYQLVVMQPGDAVNDELFRQIEALIQDTVERG